MNKTARAFGSGGLGVAPAGLLNDLEQAGFFPHEVTIEEHDGSQTSSGQLDPDGWAAMKGHISLPASVSAVPGQEVKTGRNETDITRTTITLKGHYPLVTAEKRAVEYRQDGAKTWDILDVQLDDLHILTALAVRKV